MTWVKTQCVLTLTSLDTSHDSCHSAGQLDGDLHRDSALNITTELIFVLQIQEITATETKSMCRQVFSNKYIYNRLSVLEYIVLWTRCVILVITITNSRPGAPINSDVAIYCGFEMTSQLLPLTLSERTSHRQSNDAIWDLTSWLTSWLNRVSMIFLCEYDLTWTRTESQVRLGAGPSQVLSQVSSQDC